MTSQAMLFTTWSDMSSMTRRAILSICASVRSLPSLVEGCHSADLGAIDDEEDDPVEAEATGCPEVPGADGDEDFGAAGG